MPSAALLSHGHTFRQLLLCRIGTHSISCSHFAWAPSAALMSHWYPFRQLFSYRMGTHSASCSLLAWTLMGCSGHDNWATSAARRIIIEQSQQFCQILCERVLQWFPVDARGYLPAGNTLAFLQRVGRKRLWESRTHTVTKCRKKSKSLKFRPVNITLS